MSADDNNNDNNLTHLKGLPFFNVGQFKIEKRIGASASGSLSTPAQTDKIFP